MAEEPRQGSARRRGIGLCLSGGGFRAALFHLGALRRMHETGLLRDIDSVSSVSGGSIIAAHLATRIASGGAIRNWEAEIAAPFRGIASRNLRTAPLLRSFLPGRRGVERLAARYHEVLTPITLEELPARPRFIFCATDLGGACNWVFERSQIGDWRVGYLRPAPRDLPLAVAVAASSCFPPMFQPWRPRYRAADFTDADIADVDQHRRAVHDLRLTDGGVYDNMALEPVWKSHQRVLVSDGGALIPLGRVGGGLTRLMRYAAVSEHQARALRKRWLISSFVNGALEGSYWGIATVDDDRAELAYPSGVVSRIAAIRTDLDAFDEREQRILENHGYLTAAHALREGADVPVSAPFPEWMDAHRAAEALEDSARRRFWGRSGRGQSPI